MTFHASLIVRGLGDVKHNLARWRAWGGLLNAVALRCSSTSRDRSCSRVASRPRSSVNNPARRSGSRWSAVR